MSISTVLRVHNALSCSSDEVEAAVEMRSSVCCREPFVRVIFACDCRRGSAESLLSCVKTRSPLALGSPEGKERSRAISSHISTGFIIAFVPKVPGGQDVRKAITKQENMRRTQTCASGQSNG